MPPVAETSVQAEHAPMALHVGKVPHGKFDKLLLGRSSTEGSSHYLPMWDWVAHQPKQECFPSIFLSRHC